MASPEYVLDAHALIWFYAGSPRLGSQAKQVMSDPASRLVIPSIALAEVCWIVGKGRVAEVTVDKVLEAIDADPRVLIAPLTREVVVRAAKLSPGLEMHDALIVATALLGTEQGGDVRVVTKDEAITQSGLVPVLW